jgi:hypothetical protein
METISIEKLRTDKRRCEDLCEQLNAKLENELATGGQIENICGLINSCRRDLEAITKAIRRCEPTENENENEQDRKAIAIIAGGKGVEIRAKNDDATKYTVRKRQTYDEIIKKRYVQKPNGKTTQEQAVKL